MFDTPPAQISYIEVQKPISDPKKLETQLAISKLNNIRINMENEGLPNTVAIGIGRYSHCSGSLIKVSEKNQREGESTVISTAGHCVSRVLPTTLRYINYNFEGLEKENNSSSESEEMVEEKDLKIDYQFISLPSGMIAITPFVYKKGSTNSSKDVAYIIHPSQLPAFRKWLNQKIETTPTLEQIRKTVDNHLQKRTVPFVVTTNRNKADTSGWSAGGNIPGGELVDIGKTGVGVNLTLGQNLDSVTDGASGSLVSHYAGGKKIEGVLIAQGGVLSSICNSEVDEESRLQILSNSIDRGYFGLDAQTEKNRILSEVKKANCTEADLSRDIESQPKILQYLYEKLKYQYYHYSVIKSKEHYQLILETLNKKYQQKPVEEPVNNDLTQNHKNELSKFSPNIQTAFKNSLSKMESVKKW
jgi:hypothetical protein